MQMVQRPPSLLQGGEQDDDAGSTLWNGAILSQRLGSEAKAITSGADCLGCGRSCPSAASGAKLSVVAKPNANRRAMDGRESRLRLKIRPRELIPVRMGIWAPPSHGS